jgi:hypothetical protein
MSPLFLILLHFVNTYLQVQKKPFTISVYMTMENFKLKLQMKFSRKQKVSEIPVLDL